MGNGQVLDSSNTEDKQYWHKLVEYGVGTGEFNDVDPDVVMDTFLYAYHGVAMWRRVLEFQGETIDHLTDAVRTYTEVPLDIQPGGEGIIRMQPNSFAFIEW